MIRLCDLHWRKRRSPSDILVGKVADFWIMLVPRGLPVSPIGDVADLNPVYAACLSDRPSRSMVPTCQTRSSRRPGWRCTASILAATVKPWRDRSSTSADRGLFRRPWGSRGGCPPDSRGEWTIRVYLVADIEPTAEFRLPHQIPLERVLWVADQVDVTARLVSEQQQ